jgi:hypothetical protein
MRRVAIALLHYPVLDRQGAVVTTAITNLDLHDIARSAHTFGLSDFFVVHPVAAQRELAHRVREHWLTGSGARRIPDRTPPMRTLRVVDSLQAALSAFSSEPVEIWATSAKSSTLPVLDYAEAQRMLQRPGNPVLIVFGTGWGLAAAVSSQADRQLEPIFSARADGYNHLSVRAAAAITFDRLFGVRSKD